MTLSFVNTSGAVGPGMRIDVSSDVVGAIPNDDYVLVQLKRDSDGSLVMFGEALQAASHAWLVTFGKSIHNLQPAGLDVGLEVAEGAACSLVAFQYHANGTFVDSGGPTSGYTYTRTAGLYALFTGLNGGSSIDEILAAVQTTFPATS